MSCGKVHLHNLFRYYPVIRRYNPPRCLAGSLRHCFLFNVTIGSSGGDTLSTGQLVYNTLVVTRHRRFRVEYKYTRCVVNEKRKLVVDVFVQAKAFISKSWVRYLTVQRYIPLRTSGTHGIPWYSRTQNLLMFKQVATNNHCKLIPPRYLK